MFVSSRIRNSLDHYEMIMSSWMERHGYRLLRIAMGIIFIWFGALKPFVLITAGIVLGGQRARAHRESLRRRVLA
jgi:hypothetical protein